MFATVLTLALGASVARALSVEAPSGVTSGGNMTIKWSSTSSDPIFTIELMHTSFNEAFAIANNVAPGLGSLSLMLPQVPAEGEYTLQLVNVTNINQVYATSGAFSIGAASGGGNGGASGSTTSTTGSGATGSSASGSGAGATGSGASVSGSATTAGSVTAPSGSSASNSASLSRSGAASSSASASRSASASAASASTTTGGAAHHSVPALMIGALTALLGAGLAL
ncbi:hypothetical protein B0H15DRAFT_1004608 [Mycena belliarum]|uniref:Yeast cell wall synthesis Kre9/Knh1-like N-terminal domain-containing protein n=1 Tax=Mycena belliarum TaxID=1033014 RepID=A0AAD6TR52_9AGAR|nr:hypothetical protein B0H15DRAFT_1004608 [Mycena belliae]